MESLQETEKLIVKQKFEALEAMANVAANALDMDALGNLGEVANKYDVYDAGNGGSKFKVVEESDYCGLTGRCCCNPNHELSLHVFAPSHSPSKEVMFFDRPCKCGQCCSVCDICRQEMVISDGNRNQVCSMPVPKSVFYFCINGCFIGSCLVDWIHQAAVPRRGT